MQLIAFLGFRLIVVWSYQSKEGTVVLTDPKDTLAYHQSRVFCRQRDMRNVPCGRVTEALKHYKTAVTDMAKPETEALWFYGLNHVMSLISARRAPLEPLTDEELELVTLYHDASVEKSVRAFYYLILICTREARHNQSKSADLPKIKAKFGDEIATFFGKAGNESDIHQRLLDSPPSATIGQYVDALAWQFYNSKWSGGYGGKAWGKVTDCLVRFVKGEFSAEMMMDTVWTLAHNNGPIFNKGHLYQMYSANLVRILDIQRSGQVPEAILHDQKVGAYVDLPLRQVMQQVEKMFPGSIKNHVDWYVVEALGAVHKYPQDKEAQKNKHGLSPNAAKAEKEAKLKADAAAKKAIEDKIKEAKEFFTVMPGVKVKKIQRVPAAA